jgi:hypothetical protein
MATRIKEIATVAAYDHQGASVYLRIKLGPMFQWGKLLEAWRADNPCGPLRGVAGLSLVPAYRSGRMPLYAPEALDDFVAHAMASVAGLGPAPLRPQAFDIDADALRYPVHWRLRRARRCTGKSSPTA